jgi:hypothetical protein
MTDDLDNENFIKFLKENASIAHDGEKCNHAHYLLEQMNNPFSLFKTIARDFNKSFFSDFLFEKDRYTYFTNAAIDKFRKWCISQPKCTDSPKKYAYEIIGRYERTGMLVYFMSQPDYKKVLSIKIYNIYDSFVEVIRSIIAHSDDKKMIEHNAKYFAFFPHEIRSNYDNCKLSLKRGDPRDYIYWLLPENQIMEILASRNSLYFGDNPTLFEKKCLRLHRYQNPHLPQYKIEKNNYEQFFNVTTYPNPAKRSCYE